MHSHALEDHEVVRHETSEVDVKLNGTSGTVIRIAKADVTLTNRYIRIASEGCTYTVAGKGDRNFTKVHVPLLCAKPHRFIQPWFGPYKWETQVQGALPLEPSGDAWTLTLTFSSGGAFEYRTKFLQAFGEASQAASEGMEEVLPAYSVS